LHRGFLIDLLRRGSRLAWLLLAVPLAACPAAHGNKYPFQYRPAEVAPPTRGAGRVVLFAVRDERLPVVAGKEPPAYVGEQRDGLGGEHTVVTTDGRSLADILAEAVTRDLEAAGFEVVAVEAPEPASPAAIAAFLAERGARRGLNVVMREFNSNTYSNIDVEWNLLASVRDERGEQIASKQLQGRETLEKQFRAPIRAGQEQVSPFFYRLVRDLVGHNEGILAGLLGADGSARPRGCTTDQILTMQGAGFTAEQIRAACPDR
jgi:hypothetical protein